MRLLCGLLLAQYLDIWHRRVVDTTDARKPSYRGLSMPHQLLEQEEVKREDVLSERDEALAQVQIVDDPITVTKNSTQACYLLCPVGPC